MKKCASVDMHRTGRKIKQLMQHTGLTVRDIQEYLGLETSQSVYHWFNGRNLPSVDNLYALSGLFHVPVDAMLCGDRRESFDFCRQPSRRHLYAYYERFLELRAG